MSIQNNILEDEPNIRKIIIEDSAPYEEDNYEDEDDTEDDNISIEEAPNSLYFDLVSYIKDLGIPIAEYLTTNTIQDFVDSFLPE